MVLTPTCPLRPPQVQTAIFLLKGLQGEAEQGQTLPPLISFHSSAPGNAVRATEPPEASTVTENNSEESMRQPGTSLGLAPRSEPSGGPSAPFPVGLHGIVGHLLLGRKAMTNLNSVLKSRDITLPTNVRLVKAIVFPVVMYGCESWAIKKAEHQRSDAFRLWCWRRLLTVPWTARRSNQSIQKEISPGCSLEGLRPKLKLQYFGHLM